MDESLTALQQIIEQTSEVIGQIDKKKIIGEKDDSSNLLGQKELIEDIINWSKWLLKCDRSTLSRIFTEADLEVLKVSFRQSADLLLVIQNDRSNDNRSGRVFIDRDSLVRDLLLRHSQLLPIGRARVNANLTQNEMRKIVDAAQETLDDTKALLSQETVGTLAEHFQRLVISDKTKPYRTDRNPFSDKWRSESKLRKNYRKSRRGIIGYEERARKWFWLSTLTALVTSAYGYLIVFGVDKVKSTDMASLIYAKVTLKIIALAVPLLIIRFCLKNYAAYSHLATINKHRAAILKTFRTIKEDSRITTQDQILVEMIKIIAEPGETGLISKNEGAGDSSLNINAPFKP